MADPLQVLFVEDSEDDALLIIEELRAGGFSLEYVRVDTPAMMRQQLAQNDWNLVLADFSMPHFSGPAALRVLLESGKDIPLILVSATVKEEEAIDMMHAGAKDFVLKHNLTRLAPAVTRELNEAQSRKERRAAQEALAESEANYRLVMATATDAILTIDETDRILFANPSTERIFGYTPAELIGQPLTMLMPERFRVEHHAAFMDYYRTHTRHIPWNSVEFSGLRKDGQEVALEIAIGAFMRNEHLVVVGIVRDIRERKRAEERLRASEETFRTVFNSVYDAIILHDREGNILDVNDRMLASYGVTRTEALQMSFSQDLSAPSALVERLPEIWDNALADHAQLFEWRACRPHEGVEFDVEVYVRRINLDSRGVIMANVRDITERKAADRARNQFLSVLSHELRTPLTNILGWVMEAQTTPEIIPEALRIIQRNAESQRRMLENLLEVSRLIHSRLTLQRQATDLWPFVRGVIDQVKPRAQERRLEMVVALSTEQVIVDIDRKRLAEALDNIFDNAIRFTNPGGTITVTSHRGDVQAQLSVEDTGRGIAPARLSGLFSLFQVTTEGDAREGLGVGLPLARTIIALHGGELAITSAGEGQGTVVTVSLPIRQA